jgi:hypothetical protein
MKTELKSKSPMIAFTYEDKSFCLPSNQKFLKSFSLYCPNIGNEIMIYYSEQYPGTVLISRRYEMVSNSIIMIFGLTFLIIGFCVLIGVL